MVWRGLAFGRFYVFDITFSFVFYDFRFLAVCGGVLLMIVITSFANLKVNIYPKITSILVRLWPAMTQ